MKRLIFTAAAALFVSGVFAQNLAADTNKKLGDTTQTEGPRYLVKHGDHQFSNDTIAHNSGKHYPKFSIGITFSRFDLGLATLVDNGSFTLSPQNQFLRYRSWKTSNVGFDVFQMGVRFSNAFKIYVSGGFDWTLIRLRNNITILPNQPVLTYRQDNIDYSKNRFSSSYLRVPLSFEFRTKAVRHGERFHFVFGPDGGFLLDGMVKQISHEFGKQKVSDSYHFTTFRYGGFARIGYGDVGIFAKYYTNDMFENSPAQAGLKNFSFGFTAGF
ncbi:MAG: outer membrane beta-barrel protein [Sphingobacteriales bacterium]